MSNLPNIDRLGLLLAEISELTKQADVIKAQLREMGDGAYEGEVFRATVSTNEPSTLDMAAVREHLSRQFITANTKVTEIVTVKVVARNGKGVKEAA
jgi:hypothetical protein